MIAPEPFFEPRGTPFSEYHRIRALIDLGHTVDLVTYPFGRDVDDAGTAAVPVRAPAADSRCSASGRRWRRSRSTLTLAFTAIRRAVADRYDAVHSHEEGSIIGVLLALALGVPHLYDMHSSLPQQLTNFEFTKSRLLKHLFARMERFVVRRSNVVVVICPHLAQLVSEIEPSVPVGAD